VYSEVDDEDTRRMRFEVIGKAQGNFLIYKNIKNRNYVSVYNNEMEQVSRQEMDYIPEERLINIDFFPYQDFTYVIYQYEKKRVVYCDAVKVDGSGKRVSEIISLDTAHIGFGGNNKIYNTISSEDKSKLMVFKINTRNKERFVLTTILFDNLLTPLRRSRIEIPMEEYKDALDEFHVDNDGDLVFTKFIRNTNETITNAFLLYKGAFSDTLHLINVQPEKLFLDALHVKSDNANKRFFVTSFYSGKKRGDVEGFYFFVWDKNTRAPILQNTVGLNEELRREARGGNTNVKSAFNDYFIRNIIVRRDGGFVINTESFYTTSRGSQWNRFNYLYGYPMTSFDYYNVYSPYNSLNWRRDPFFNNRNNVRYNADNITVLSFDKTGKLEWSNVIHKEQFDDESDDRISYQTMNTGGQIHYVFNLDEKRALLLNDFTLSPDGQITRNPTLKNLDRGYEFMPKYGKQVSSYQMIIPCYYRNSICFAKVEFSQ
jgi:Ca2+-binding EF-hand superfamily protein